MLVSDVCLCCLLFPDQALQTPYSPNFLQQSTSLLIETEGVLEDGGEEDRPKNQPISKSQ